MTRKLICTFLALLLCMSLAVSASAESKAVDFVIDEFGYLAPEELNELNGLALGIYEKTGVGIFFVYTTEENLSGYDVLSLTGGMEDYFVMLENETSWYTFKSGLGEGIDEDKEYELRDIYDVAETYVGGVEDFLIAAGECFPPIQEAPQIQETLQVIAPEPEEWLLFDEADLLTAAEEETLEQKLADISHSYNAQIVIATLDSLDGIDMDDFVEFVYDSMGLGYGEDHDGVLLLVCMDPREYRILSNGFAGVAIDSDDIDNICGKIEPKLSDGDYAEAFDAFAEKCDYYLDGHLNGFPFNLGNNLATSLIIGIVVGLIVAFVLKSQLKTVRKQDKANVYVKSGSMHVNVSNDIFLYRTVTRTERQKNTSSGSSGGTARSKGGGSF